MKSILVIDDEHDIVLALEMIFQEEGYEVQTAGNGREALKQLAARVPDLVLVDNMMPLLSGADLIAEIRRTPQWQHLPVILMSVVPPKTTKTPPWDAFIAKPFELDHVLATVKRLIK